MAADRLCYVAKKRHKHSAELIIPGLLEGSKPQLCQNAVFIALLASHESLVEFGCAILFQEEKTYTE